MAYEGMKGNAYDGPNTTATEGQLSRAVNLARKESERLQECVQSLERSLCQVLRPVPPSPMKDPGVMTGTGGGAEMTCRVNDLGYTISQTCSRIEDMVSRLEV